MNKKQLFLTCAIGASLALTSCQDEDFGVSQQEVAKVAYNRNFESVFGKVAPDQDFDFYAQVMKELQGGAQTRAGEIVSVGDFIDYDIDQDIITKANSQFPDNGNNSSKGTQAGTLIVQDTKFTVSSVNFGGDYELSKGSGTNFLSYGFEFGVEVGGQMYKIWGPSSEANGNTASGVANPEWSKEVTVPYGSSVRFYISYYGDWNAEHKTYNGREQGLVTAAQCPTCDGKGHTADKCEVCGGDGTVDVTTTTDVDCTNKNNHKYTSPDGKVYVRTNNKNQTDAIQCPENVHNGKAPSLSDWNGTACTICGGTSRNYLVPCSTCKGKGTIPQTTTTQENCTAEGCNNGIIGEVHECETCHGCGINPNTTLPKHIMYSDSKYCVIAEDATNAGADGEKLFQVIAFEDDENFETNKNGGDFNDFMVAITADKLPLVVDNAKRFMCEDMSGSDRETAWDFNDIVFDIQAKTSTLDNKTTYSTKLYLQAVGGTWPIKLFINDGNGHEHQVGDDELHKVLANADYDTPINVGTKNGTSTAGAKTFDYDDIQLTPEQLLDKVNEYIYALVYTGADKSQWETDTDNWTKIEFQAPGQPAQIVACPAGTPWMREDQLIKKTYDFPNREWWATLKEGGAQYLYTGN